MTRVGVVRFPGSNCETETLAAIHRAGGEGILLDYRETSLQQCDSVILPGGFAYGDYLRSGAIARFAPIMDSVREHARAGGAVVGICNGFQVLCEAHLLPGALLRNAQQRFVSQPVHVKVERTSTVVTRGMEPGEVFHIPVAHGEGRFVADDTTLQRLDAEDMVVLRYLDQGEGDENYNPNGSVRDIAGICNPDGNVVGFMPHPERMAEVALGSDRGQRFFTSLVAAAAGVAA